MTRNGRTAWRLRVHLPTEYVDQGRELFVWTRDWLIPTCLNAPFRCTLELVPPEDVHPDD